MPNADTMGETIRKELIEASIKNKNIFLFESLGSIGYYTALKHCKFVLGNSSSGIVEAASFGKYVINLGNRQLGREFDKNVLHTQINLNAVTKSISKIKSMPKLSMKNIYGSGRASITILKCLKLIETKEYNY